MSSSVTSLLRQFLDEDGELNQDAELLSWTSGGHAGVIAGGQANASRLTTPFMHGGASSLVKSLKRDHREHTGAEPFRTHREHYFSNNENSSAHIDGDSHQCSRRPASAKPAHQNAYLEVPQLRIYKQGVAQQQRHEQFIERERARTALEELTHRPEISAKSKKIAQERLERPGMPTDLADRLYKLKGITETKRKETRVELDKLEQEKVSKSKPPPSHSGLTKNGAEVCEYLYKEGQESRKRREELHKHRHDQLPFKPKLTDASKEIIKNKQGANASRDTTTFRKNVFAKNEYTFKPEMTGESRRLAEAKRRKETDLVTVGNKQAADKKKKASAKSSKKPASRPRFSTSSSRPTTAKSKRPAPPKTKQSHSHKTARPKSARTAITKDRNHWLHAEAAVKRKRRESLHQQGEEQKIKATCTFTPKTSENTSVSSSSKELYVVDGKSKAHEAGTLDGSGPTVKGNGDTVARLALWQQQRNQRLQEKREAKAKTEFKECTFKPQRDESTHSLAKVRATVNKSNKNGTAKAQKQESSINQFVERQNKARELKAQASEITYVTGENWTKEKTKVRPFSFEERDAAMKSSKKIQSQAGESRASPSYARLHGKDVPGFFLNSDTVSPPRSPKSTPAPKPKPPTSFEMAVQADLPGSPLSIHSIPSPPSPVSPASPPPERVLDRAINNGRNARKSFRSDDGVRRVLSPSTLDPQPFVYDEADLQKTWSELMALPIDAGTPTR